ncbi:MAG: hypothetical protein LBO05_04990 [Deltaproteobacteria bacterium]|jgi:hypothetical protein|nr:hypothetical protein [Deltaproteobacteria bacterium]
MSQRYGPAAGPGGRPAQGRPGRQGLPNYYPRPPLRREKPPEIKLAPGEILSFSWRLLVRKYPQLLAIHAPYIFCLLLIELHQLYGLDIEVFFFEAVNILYVICPVLLLCYQAAAARYVCALVAGGGGAGGASVGRSIVAGLKNCPAVFIVSFLILLLSSFTFSIAANVMIFFHAMAGFWVVVPALIFVGLLAVWIASVCTSLAACGADGLGSLQAVGLAQSLAKGNHFKIACVLVPLAVLTGGFGLIFRGAVLEHGLSRHLVLAFGFGYVFIDAAVALVLAVTLCRLKVVKESNKFAAEAWIFDAGPADPDPRLPGPAEAAVRLPGPR